MEVDSRFVVRTRFLLPLAAMVVAYSVELTLAILSRMVSFAGYLIKGILGATVFLFRFRKFPNLPTASP